MELKRQSHIIKLRVKIILTGKFCNNDKCGDKSLIVSTKKPKWPFNLFKTYLTRFQFSQDLVHWLSSICSFSELTKLSYCNVSHSSNSNQRMKSILGKCFSAAIYLDQLMQFQSIQTRMNRNKLSFVYIKCKLLFPLNIKNI